MRTSPNDGNVLFNRDEEFRQRVIRQALMLGMQAEEYNTAGTSVPDRTRSQYIRWRFKYKEAWYFAYPSLYSAAFEYLRMLEVPNEVIGVVRHE